jgi:hypothetical protein
MATPISLPATDAHAVRSSAAQYEERNESLTSAVPWAAIIAGGLTTSAFGLLLLALGTGFELAAISPFSARQGPLSQLGWTTIAWMIFSQVVGGALGGYLAGRLRTKWARLHTDEVYFRDTAHGFLAWAFATLGSAALLASAGTAMTLPARTIIEESRPAATVYYQAPAGAAVGAAADRTATDVAQAIDAQRKVAARLLLWTFVALLCGAFSASFAATIGGRQRDNIPAI